MTLLTRYATAAFCILATSTVCAQSVPYDQRDRAQTLKRDLSYAEPAAYLPTKTTTKLVLEVKDATNDLDDTPILHHSYNGCLVGPTIHVRPGSSLDIKLENHLDPEPAPTGHDINIPHGFNTTNLHTHGLHVSPSGRSDNVFLELAPGNTCDLHFDIRANHPPGTFWYHAHKHGSTAFQLASGMAGALIVDGGLDDAPGIRGAVTRILVLQQYVYRTRPGQPAIVLPDDVYSGNVTPIPTVNGLKTPTITMRPGEVERWRIIHAGIEDPIVLHFEGITLHEIAVDGLALGCRVDRDELELQPGYRSDILIKSPLTPDAYVLTTAVRDPKRSFRNRIVESHDLLKLDVAGAPHDMPLPTSDDLRPYAAYTDADVPSTSDVEQFRDIKLQGADVLAINGAKFDPNRVAHEIRVGSAEQWTVSSELGGHPFHVHVNPFAVRVPQGDPNPHSWIWRDTLFVPSGSSAELRAWFHDYPGRSVLHCHILDHEDQGMMQTIELHDAADTGSALALVPATGDELSPKWQVTGVSGSQIRGTDLAGRRHLLVFTRGMTCEHCAIQLSRLASHQREFLDRGIAVVAVCESLPEGQTLGDVATRLSAWFPVCLDSHLVTFRAFGCIAPDNTSLHGLFLVDRAGVVRWHAVSESAQTDIAYILAACDRSFSSGTRE